MSLYTWLSGQREGGVHRREPIGLYAWLGGGPEGRLHYSTEERDFSTPMRSISWRATPPTFVTYNVTETYDPQEIRDYVLGLLNDSTSDIVDNITAQVIERMKDNINLTVEEALAETMIAISEPHLDTLIEEAKNE